MCTRTSRNPETGALVYDNHELISRWNYQVTKAASFNLIGQYVSTLPHADLTDAPNSKTLFADALFTYMPHPGTRFYFGYIGNFANLDRALCTREGGGMCDARATDSRAHELPDERRQDDLHEDLVPAAVLTSRAWTAQRNASGRSSC